MGSALRANRQQLTANTQAYLDGLSPNVQDILDNFEFRNQSPRLSRADALGTLIYGLTWPDINLSPDSFAAPPTRYSTPASTITLWAQSSRRWCPVSSRRTTKWQASTGPRLDAVRLMA